MFRSFFLAGFEGSTGNNRHGDWFDQVVATGHDRTVEQDYRDLDALGIHAARETVRWPLVDIGQGRYNFSSIEPVAEMLPSRAFARPKSSTFTRPSGRSITFAGFRSR